MAVICVYCASSVGTLPVYADAARAVGLYLAQQGHTLAYGGGSVGLMGILADAALAAGGKVIGVIPNDLWEREIGHNGLSELHIVRSMHERKAKLEEISDAFLALPGGVGTLDELFEIWTWCVLSIHQKPFGLLNVQDFYSPLLQFLGNTVEAGFLKDNYLRLLHVGQQPEELIPRILANPPRLPNKWGKPKA